MILKRFKNTVYFILLACISCSAQQAEINTYSSLGVGANRTESYLKFLEDKNVGVVGNQTSVIFKSETDYVHLVDSLLNRNIIIKKVFAPEHGFRGTADAGEIIKDGIDTKTGIPIISLYGSQKKPDPEHLEGIDIMVFDIQDVGARFYTYISTLHYIMEACAEQNIPLLILDRPNPNGHYIDGPVLEDEFKSFVGMHPVPVVHGLTIAEYAKMINGEKWLKNGIQCRLEIVDMRGYAPQLTYDLPIKPSPNLPNSKSINLYPSLCFFEGTNVNAGRGTSMQFQVFGSPFLDPLVFDFEYTPKSSDGAKYPKHENTLCFGRNLQNHNDLDYLNLEWLLQAYHHTQDQASFFNNFFSKLAGNASLQEQIQQGKTAQEIRENWESELNTYKKKIKPYLLYER
ncbi:exo-beta-N-acetylmuramidase NamZ domain-containing protein [Psychroflexus salinarum]|uniref:Exo-beta-N-acetylmuramidase NamZ domain-containing protein n=1 Tax=Psychroflexus salinarum TaxID=546024 RepID=A0ABW3GME9_9FLAO